LMRIKSGNAIFAGVAKEATTSVPGQSQKNSA